MKFLTNLKKKVSLGKLFALSNVSFSSENSHSITLQL